MRVRWTIATVSALALSLLTLNADLHLPWSPHLTSAVAPACPADAKAANLNFALKDLNNKTVRLSDFKGKVILLDFWATWCAPCKVEIPWFVEFQTRYAQSGLQVIGVSIDDPLDKLKPYVRDFKMNYPVLQGLHQEGIQDAYGPLWGIPVTVVISRDGKVCGRHTGLSSKDVIEKEIKALL